MAKQQQVYLSFLLRLWQTSSDDEQIWRASLESPGSGERRGFASLQALFDFLEAQTGRASPQDTQGSETGGREYEGGEGRRSF
jgi:hypothetical protein